MHYKRVYVESIGYELAPNVVTSAALEERLAPLYRKFGMPAGQIEALTGDSRAALLGCGPDDERRRDACGASGAGSGWIIAGGCRHGDLRGRVPGQL